MWRSITIFLIANYCLLAGGKAQISSVNSGQTQTRCLNTSALVAQDLYGNWVLELSAPTSSGSAQTARLLFKKNPEFAESLAGEFSLSGQRMEVFGDIEEGVLDLEESANGKDISALWKGRIAEGSCGQAITGTRRIVATQTEQSFVLRRAGW
jgi:hypothetical protein